MKNLTYAFILCLTLVSSNFAFAQEISDPWETMNRGTFWFNDKLDVNVLEPVAKGYDEVVPEPIQDGIGNFFRNLRYPSYLVSDLVQFKFEQALEHTGRFLINTTVGIGGLIDVAKHVGLEDHPEDFGIALAYHGVPTGPYLVLPILGPSNLRDAFGRLVDVFLDPVFYIGYADLSDDAETWIPIGLKTVQLIDTRADLVEAIDTARESSVDYYLFVQGAYYQHRVGVLYDGNPPDEEDLESSPSQSEPSSENIENIKTDSPLFPDER